MKMWSENFGGTDPLDDSASILSLEKKMYQELLAANAISIFDFRTYLFARQCHLLVCLQRPVDLLLRAKLFIAQITRGIVEQLQRHNNRLPAFFLESWVFSACSDVVSQCEKLLPAVQDQDDAVKYEKLKGEHLLQARRQVGCRIKGLIKVDKKT
jgi:hypothetical protein